MPLKKDGKDVALRLVKLVETQAYKCALTGRDLTPDKAALDHCVPVVRGGAIRDMENLQVLHEDVNAAKGTMTNAEFIAMCREVVVFVDSQNQR